METLWVIIALAFVVALVFSMFGQGGGSVYTPILFLFGYAVLVSVSTSLVLNLITSVSAGYVFYRHGMIDFKRALLFVPGIIVGSLTGSVVDNLHVVSTTFLLWLFVAFLIVAGARMIYSFRERGKAEGDVPTTFSKRMYALIIIVSFLVGLLSSMLGSRRRHNHRPVHGLRLQVSHQVGGRGVAPDHFLLGSVRGHRTLGFWQSRPPADPRYGRRRPRGRSLGGRIGVRMKSGAMKVGVGIIMWILAAQVILKITGYL